MNCVWVKAQGWRFGSFRAAVRKHGARGTCLFVVDAVVDRFFDVRYGTDTKRRVEVARLDARGPSVAHAVHYSATRPREFRRLMSGLDIPAGGVFVDLGSGKGRVLLMASEYKFRRVIGVEFSSALCRIARSNVVRFRQRRRASTCPVTVTESDAAEYQFNDEETVLFLFNPFGAPVLSAVLDHLQESIRKRPRKVWIIYYNPVFADLVEENGFIPLTSGHGYRTFTVYTTSQAEGDVPPGGVSPGH